MADAITTYPAGLPNPSVLTHEVPDRVRSSSLPGAYTPEGKSRDHVRNISTEFFLTAEQADTFYLWWETQLLRGGKWFNAPWSNLEGAATVPTQFLTAPSFRHVYNGAYRISASLQVRSRSRVVTGCTVVTENFTAGLTGYNTIQGNAGVFTVGGNTIFIASQTTGTYAQIRKQVLTSPLQIQQMGCDFRCTSIGADDSGWMTVRGPTESASIVPIRDSIIDPPRRPRIFWQGNTGPVGPSQVTLNTWYRSVAYLIPGVGIGYEIRDLQASTVWSSGILAAAAATAPSIDSFEWVADAPATTGAAEFRNIWFSSCSPVNPLQPMYRIQRASDSSWTGYDFTSRVAAADSEVDDFIATLSGGATYSRYTLAPTTEIPGSDSTVSYYYLVGVTEFLGVQRLINRNV